MKDILSKIRTFSIYKNMLLIYLTSVILVVALIIAASYGIFLNYAKKQSSWYLDQLVGQITYSFSSVMSQLEDVYEVIADDTCFTRYTTYKTQSTIIDYDLFFRLNEIQSYYSFIENVSVINLEKADSIRTQRSPVNDITFALDYCPENEEELKLVYRKKEFELNASRYFLDIISVIKYLPGHNSIIVADIPLENLRSSNAVIHEYNELNALYLVDDKGQVISPEHSAVSSKESEAILSLLQPPPSGSRFITYKNRQTYLFSRLEGLSCWFVGVHNNAFILDQFQWYSFYFILLALLLAAGGSVLFWKNTNKAFAPLIILLEKYRHSLPDDYTIGTNEYVYLQKIIDTMAHEKYIHEIHARQEFLKNLLLQPSAATPPGMLPFYEEQFLHPHYYVLLFSIASGASCSKSCADLDILRFAIRNISEELFASDADCFSTDIDSTHVAVILGLITPDRLSCTEKIEQIRSIFRRSWQIELTASLGHMVDIHGLSDSYHRAVQYMKFNFHYQVEGFIDSNHYLEDRYLDKNMQLNSVILQYVEKNYTDVNLSINMVAQEMHLSSTYVGKLFKAINDITFSNYLSEFRLEKSRQLLQTSGETINVISEKVGFANSTYYTTLFKKKYCCTPTRYRNANHK